MIASQTMMSLPPFYELIEAHGAELMRYARRLSGDAAAEDVLQEAFLRALRSYPRLRHAEHLRAWLFRITTTAAYDHASKKKGEVLTKDIPEVPADPHFDDGAFDSLIEPLTPSAREAFKLRFVDDLSFEEVSERLGCSPAAARQRVSTGVRELRRLMS